MESKMYKCLKNFGCFCKDEIYSYNEIMMINPSSDWVNYFISLEYGK